VQFLRLPRVLWRLLRLLLQVAAGCLTIVCVFPRLSIAQREQRVQAWSLGMLRALGVTLEVHGQPVATGPVLLVANHISWLDILVMHAARFCRFVSKADVHHWPVIGRLATGAGTLYIERASRRDAMRVVHRMAQALREGQVVAVFPEGTTGDGRSLLPFHANLLQAAVSVDAPVQPVGLRFLDAATRAPSFTPCYVDDDTLVGSVWRTLSGPPVVAVVQFGSVETAAGRDRRAWAQDLHARVAALVQPEGLARG
jgi:1-acyl-sn-glycerol-3-phosphate acyltransferase